MMLLRSARPWLCLQLWFFVIALAIPSAGFAQDTPQYRKLRLRLVNNVLARDGITDEAVLAAVRNVPRHAFVRRSQRPMAYFDQALPIGFQQTISPPYIVSYMTQTIEPKPTDRVLEIGTGSGYQAAVLAEIVEHVYTIEIVEPLGKAAAQRLKSLGYDNVTAKVGDGYLGWEEHAPFDKIIVTCSPEDVPKPLIEQLREGGKMIIPLGERHQQVFYLFEKKEGELVKQQLIPTLFVPMTGQAESERAVKPDPLHPQVNNGSFELDENEDEAADSWHYQRQNQRLSGGAAHGKWYMQFKNDTPGRGAQILQGFAVDGRQVRKLDIRLWVQLQRARPGKRNYDQPSLQIYFYDKSRKTIGDAVIGPWTGDFSWKEQHETITVPRHATEAIIRLGLNGGVGLMDVDDVRILAVE